MLEEKPYKAATRDDAAKTIAALIVLDDAESIVATLQADKSWLIKAMVPKQS